MFKFLIRKRAEERGITSPIELADKTGLHRTTTVGLWGGFITRVDLSTFSKLLKVFELNSLDDLIEYDNDDASDGPPAGDSQGT